MWYVVLTFVHILSNIDIYLYIKKRYAKVPNIISFLGIMESKNWLNLTNLCCWNCLKWSHQFPLNYICYIFCFRAVCYSILHVLLTLYCLLFKIFDKKDDFNFHIVNFPLICSNIPAAPAYGVYISHKTKDRVIRTSLKTGAELRYSEKVSSSCSTSDTRRVNLIVHIRISLIEGLC
jgi:hypothetical protein